MSTQLEALRARLVKAGIQPEALAALVWSIRPARMMTSDDIEVLADRVTDKMGMKLQQIVRVVALEQCRNDRVMILDELRGLVRIELEQLIAELGQGVKTERQQPSNGQTKGAAK